MATHSDDDFSPNPEQQEALRRAFREKAEWMTTLGINQITHGAQGEKPLYREMVDGICITRMPDDPLALRVSVGDAFNLDDEGSTYCVFRGKPSEAIALLERALEAMRKSHNEVASQVPE